MSQRRSQAARHLNTMGAKAKLMFNRYLLYKTRKHFSLVLSFIPQFRYILFLIFSFYYFFQSFISTLFEDHNKVNWKAEGLNLLLSVKNQQISTFSVVVKEVNQKGISFNRNAEKQTFSLKMAEILNVSCKKPLGPSFSLL